MARVAEHRIENLDPRLQIQMVNADSGRIGTQMDKAYDVVHEQTRIDPQQGRLSRLASIPRLIWRSNITRDHIQHRGFREAGEQIRAKGGNYIGSAEDYKAEMSAIVERFTDDILDPGETNVNMDAVLLDKLKYAIKEYAAIDSVDDRTGFEALEGQVNQFLKEHGPNMMSYGHNIFEVAKTARQTRMHGESMARIDNAMSGRYGVARAGVRTQHQRSITDITVNAPEQGILRNVFRRRAREGMNRNGLTFVNETTGGTAMVAGATAARLAVKSTVTAVTHAATFGATGGAWAATRSWREGGRRRQHGLREYEAGSAAEGQMDGTKENPRMDRLHRTKYDAVHASKLIVDLDEAIKDIDPHDPETLDNAITAIAKVKTRRDISNQLNIGLIQYSSKKTIERERTALYKRLREAEDTLQRVYDNLNDAQPHPARHGPLVLTPRDVQTTAQRQRQHQLGRIFGPLTGRRVGHANTITNMPPNIRTMVEARMHGRQPNGQPSIWNQLIADINNKDRIFRRQQIRRAAMIGSIAMVTGGVVGFATQEAAAQIIGDARTVFGHSPRGDPHTFLADIFRTTKAHGYQPKVHDVFLSGHKQPDVRISSGLHVVSAHGHEQLIDSNGHTIISDLQFKPDHNVITQNIQAAHAHGLSARQGYIDLGHHHYKTITEFRTPTEFTTPTQLPGVVPLYYLRGHEKMVAGKPWERLSEFSTELDTKRQAETYLRSLAPKTHELVDDMADKLHDDPRNRDKTTARPRAVVIIPADASKDSRNIYDTLLQYERQLGVEGFNPSSELEIVVLVAKRNNNRTRLLNEVERFQAGLNRNGKRRHRNLHNIKVRIVEETIPTSHQDSRRVREAITGAVIQDLLERGLDLNKLALIYNGSDNGRIDPNYVSTMLRGLGLTETDDDQTLPPDFIVGRNGRNRGPDPARNPAFQQRVRRTSRMLERFLVPRPGYLGSTRANLAFRPEAYVTASRRRIQPGRVAYNERIGAMVR